MSRAAPSRDSSEAARASLACASVSSGAVVLTTTVSCGATLRGYKSSLNSFRSPAGSPAMRPPRPRARSTKEGNLDTLSRTHTGRLSTTPT